MLSLKKKMPVVIGCEVKVRELAPMIHVLDNTEDIARVLIDCAIPGENWDFDEKTGLLTINGKRKRWVARGGNYLVADGILKVYEDIEDLREIYQVMN